MRIACCALGLMAALSMPAWCASPATTTSRGTTEILSPTSAIALRPALVLGSVIRSGLEIRRGGSRPPASANDPPDLHSISGDAGEAVFLVVGEAGRAVWLEVPARLALRRSDGGMILAPIDGGDKTALAVLGANGRMSFRLGDIRAKALAEPGHYAGTLPVTASYN